MKNALLSLGTNLGDRKANLDKALEMLTNLFLVLKISPLYSSASLLRDEQQDYYNLVVQIRTDVTPLELLHHCNEIENKMGRVRGEQQYGERIIDIDIIDYENIVMDTEKLTLPHPRMHERSFVLYPLQDVDDEYVHPVSKSSIADMVEEVADLLDIKLI